MNELESSHLMLFVPKGMTVRLLVMLVAILIFLLHTFLIFFTFHVILVFMSHVLLFALHASLMVHLFMLGKLAGHCIIFRSLFALVVLAGLTLHDPL